jgi:hypothetical protein
MKRTLFIVLLGFIAFITSEALHAQCKAEDCVAKLSDGFTFLKTYKVETTKPENEFSYVFSKDTNYMLMICNKDGSSKNVIVNVYDSNKKEIATNYDKKNNKFYPAFVYNCKSTGIYYMKFTFTEPVECVNGILAFKK